MKVNDSPLRTMLESDQSREMRDEMLRYVGSDPKRVKELMYYFLSPDLHWRFNQRAAWPLGVLGKKNPRLIAPYLKEMVSILGVGRHNAVDRNIVRILEDMTIPEDLEGQVYDKCFQLLNDMDQPIAVRVFSMTVLFNIAKKYPEMLLELQQTIEMYLPYGSAGFKNRGGKLLNKINRLLKG